MRHAHRQRVEPRPEIGLQQVETAAEFVEIAADRLPVVGVGGDPHHAAHADVRHLRKGRRTDVLHQFAHVPARLGLLRGDVYLQKNPDRTPALGRLALDGLGQPGAVNRLDQRHERGDVFDLVGLQVADHMPLDVLGQGFVFFAQLLRTALAEDAVAGIVSLADHLRGVGLRDGDQRDLRRDRRAHERQLTSYIRHCFFSFTR